MSQVPLTPIHPQPGNLLDVRSFVGRRRTTDQALRSLRLGQNLLLSDPRRMGKIFWLHYVAAESQNEFEPYLIDYEGVDTAAGFIERTIAGVGRRPDVPRRVRTAVTTLSASCWASGSVGPLGRGSSRTRRSPLSWCASPTAFPSSCTRS